MFDDLKRFRHYESGQQFRPRRRAMKLATPLIDVDNTFSLFTPSQRNPSSCLLHTESLGPFSLQYHDTHAITLHDGAELHAAFRPVCLHAASRFVSCLISGHAPTTKFVRSPLLCMPSKPCHSLPCLRSSTITLHNTATIPQHACPQTTYSCSIFY